MSAAKQTILVIGATGKQGSAVVRALDKSKYKVIAATRDASSDAAKALGVDLVEGTLDKAEVLFKEPIYGLFVALGDNDAERHLEQGLSIFDAAAKHGVKHVVYSGLEKGFPKESPVPFWNSKAKLEEVLVKQPFKWTILGPVGFMENFYWPLYLDQVSTTWKTSKVKTRKLIACSDIGKIAAEAFDHPEEYVGKNLSITGDELTPDEIISTWKEVTGQDLQAKENPVFPPGLDVAFEWFDNNEFTADLAENKKQFPWLTSFKSWLEQTPFKK
ncbi:uncharacterized protein IL334_007818 [Kwoniella shivajii]|uniref:NmrA-like domain-containing protein n=1 Tax=Kwoniella shivajii TaxID=564305 RepID=A0ABZ1DBZ5_9TREE|nr:hypothetical protein IL334_007818 [Kwoniella shivajii]